MAQNSAEQGDPLDAFASIVSRASGTPMATAVVHPVNQNALEAALDAQTSGLIKAVLIGPEQRIRTVADEFSLDLVGTEIIDTPHSHAAAQTGVDLARAGKVQALMKGALHTNELMAAIVARSTGLRTDRRMSHVFVMQTPAYPKYLLISDGALNIAPDLHTKRWIVQNAIDVANAIGIDSPKTAILAATEEVDPHMPSTVDAAALCKMAERGQIIGGVLDGPLAFDLAVSKQAVKIKGLASDVAGDADILIVPNIEAGNMLAKQLDYLAGAAAAGLVVGARVPIILTSRSDSVTERLASCALAKCYLVWKDGTS
ncbi:MAG: bifunctional enoyl-CoA hydratase/phosphate acetyltransferase [Alphaproteobacteria bacterium]|nr:bifunctional enoyl-CoA hydratase/phosphate acetyltransferase [Alphaproteobacteria bacterium]